MKPSKSTLSTLFLFLISLVPVIYGANQIISKLGEVGTDDQRISETTGTLDAFNPAIAYNSTDNEYLVVWDSSQISATDIEIYGQLLDANGNEIGTDDFRISDMGPSPASGYVAQNPHVVYNPTENEYLVVWQGDDSIASTTQAEYEIYGQRLDSDGNEIGTNDFPISDLGDNTTDYNAIDPKVAYNSTANEYLVVWSGDDNSGTLVNNEFEIFGQRLDAGGNEIGTDDFRISDMGPNGNVLYGADSPNVAYNSTDNQYLVVWDGDDDTAPQVNNESEIWGQLLDTNGSEIGTNDFRISHAGVDGFTLSTAYFPAVAYNSVDNQYLVTWGQYAQPENFFAEDKIIIERLTATGAIIGSPTQISQLEPDNDADYSSNYPEVVFNPTSNEYLVTWIADTSAGGLAEDEFEVYAQVIDSDGTEIGTNDMRVSAMGPDGDNNYSADGVAVTFNRLANEYMVAWSSDDDTAPLVNNDFEIFVQRLEASSAAGASVDSLIAYPVPFRPSQGHTTMTLANLPEGANIRIYTIAGELVRELTSNSSGQATWDAKNDAGDKVASGVYLVLAKSGGSTKTMKVVVQR